ncbi:hypothetical protein LIER_24385 [Lithospermum erythrorhizon]|uniref:Uncharacterized protein n=1 Tax=Lithospermum erythrorhizon TaxID=34254 RepID=A0AAV3R159_LITER
MGPIRWTTLREACTLFVRDSAFIKSQIQELRQAIPEKPSWKAYCEEGALIMRSTVNPSKVEVAAMKGKHLLRFSSQLLMNKPLILGAAPIPIVSSKRSSTSEPSVAASKKAKIEALNAVTVSSSNPQPLQTVVISLDDELTTSTHEAAGARKEKSKVPSTVRSSKEILPLLVKAGASSKKSKGKIVVAGEGSLLDCYTARGPSVEQAHGSFSCCSSLLSAGEGRKHPTSDLMDAFALCALYMIKALNASYACTRHELLKDASFEKTQEELENAQVSLKEREEELNSAKEALSAEELKCKQHQEETQTMELDHAKNIAPWKLRCSSLYVDSPLAEAPAEDVEVPTEGGEVAEGEVADEEGGRGGEVA